MELRPLINRMNLAWIMRYLFVNMMRKWWFVNIVYNKLHLARLMRYLFGWGGPFSKDRKLEREYDRGGDKVIDD